jgi:hypothetical protein
VNVARRVEPLTRFLRYRGDVPPCHELIGVRFMARFIGIVPLGIGITVIAFAWSSEFGGGFGDVPIFFRLFATFVALGFVMIGGTILFAGFKAGDPQALLEQMKRSAMATRSAKAADQQMSSEGYICPGCNAPLGANADVSPHGDVKCAHCGRWFNVHGRTR